MPAPTFGTGGTLDSTAGTTAEPGIPADVHDGTMVLGIMSLVSNVNPGAGSGFSMKYDSEALGATANPNIFVQWKRATGDEGPGTYAWPTSTGLGQLNAQAWPVENEEEDADPFHTDADALRTAATSTYGTVSITGVPAGSTLVWVGAQGGARQTAGPPGYTRISTAGVDLQQHVFVLENYAGGTPSVSGVVYLGGNTSNTVLLFAILPSDDANEGSASGTHEWNGSATGTTDYSGSASGTHVWNGTAEGPNPVTEYVEDWADLSDVNATGVQVIGNRLYSSGGTGDRGYTKAVAFPPTGIWRYQQLIYNVDAGLQNPTIRLGFSCGDPDTAVVDNDPNAIGIQMEFATRARSSFKGTALSGVTILNEEVVGVGPTTDAALLFTIDATETSYSFALKEEGAVRPMIAFRILRSDLAAEGKQPTKLYAFFTDARTTTGSSLSPFIYQTGSLAPTATKTVAGQLIEGRAQHIIVTSPSDDSPFVWWTATPPNMTDSSGEIYHIPQSLTGEGHDAWTDTRMEPITAAIIDAGYIWASSTDTVDRFANEVELDNYSDVRDFVESIVGTGRDKFGFGTSMGTMAVINLIGRGVIDFRAGATIGFAGGFIWLWHNVTEKRPEIRAAYDFVGDPTDTELRGYTAGYDPLESFVGDVDFDGVGFRFYTGDLDAITPTALSDEMSGIVLAAGATEADVNEYPGGHLSADQYQGTDLVAFYQRHASPHEGSASGTHEWNGSATGSTERSGSAAGTHEWNGSATGEREPVGSATGTHQWDGSATGEAEHTGSAAGTHQWDGTATGEREPEGSASGTHVWNGEAFGNNGETNFAIGTHVWNGTATGIGDYSGSATGSHEWNGSAAGSAVHAGSATGTHQWDGSATGESDPEGSAVGTHVWNGSAEGITTRSGSAIGTFIFDGSAAGEMNPSGSASGTHVWNGTATGASDSKSGSASGTHVWNGSATGANSPPTPVAEPVLTIRTNPARTTIRTNPARMEISS